MSVGKAEKRYRELELRRNPFLMRANECSQLTIPSLIPEQKDAGIEYKTPFQSIGARGVNNLAAKLLLALLPPNMPFFRLRIDNLVLEEEQDEEFKTEIEEGLSKIEQLVMGDVSSSTDRTVIFEGIRYLIVGGNALFYVPTSPKEKMRTFHFDQFVVRRDPSGNVIEMITREEVAASLLPVAIREKIKDTTQENDLKTAKVYTYIYRDGDVFKVFQETHGHTIPDTNGTYPLHACPWIPVRFIRSDGEDYGRSYVEEYLGDFRSLEALTQGIVEGSVASAKVIFLVNPNGMTSTKDLAETPNCGFAAGRKDDVTCVQPEKQMDLRQAAELADKIERRIAAAFLMNTSIQRAGERVTAEEIRLMAEDLETALGGVYSLLAEELQLPYVNCKLAKMQKSGKMAKLPKDVVKPAIVTGMEALGRSSDKAKLSEFAVITQQALGPQVLSQYINPLNWLKRLTASLGLDSKGLIKSDEQLQQEQQQAQMMQLTQQLGPNAINAMKDMALKGGPMNGTNAAPQ